MSYSTNPHQSSLSNVFDQSRAQFRTDYVDDKLIYLGHADASKREDERGWVIQKFSYLPNGSIERNYFPGGTPNIGNSYPNFIWSERATYDYV
jgi:hypothetical protein